MCNDRLVSLRSSKHKAVVRVLDAAANPIASEGRAHCGGSLVDARARVASSASGPSLKR